MSVFGREVSVSTKGFSDIHDITSDVAAVVREAGAREGIVNVTVIGSTASVTTIEYEPALVADFQDLLEQLAPADKPTRHGDTWGDDNGFAHLRASLMGPGITVSIHDGSLVLGTWQQIIVVDHDNRPRQRKVYVQVVAD